MTNDTIDLLLEAAQSRGEASDPRLEIADLQHMVRAAFALLTPAQVDNLKASDDLAYRLKAAAYKKARAALWPSPPSDGFVVVQQGGSSGEWYASCYDTVAAAKSAIAAIKADTYDATDPFAIPPAMAAAFRGGEAEFVDLRGAEAEFLELLNRICRAVSTGEFSEIAAADEPLCAECGGEMEADDVVCETCGAPVQLAEVRCEECGNLMIVNTDGTTNHLLPEPSAIDHDADLSHAARATEADDEGDSATAK